MVEYLEESLEKKESVSLNVKMKSQIRACCILLKKI